jgi:large subunit ribosomal protein L10
MKRTEKEVIIAEVAEIAGRAHGMFFTDFSGLTVEQATELRRELRKSGIDYKVVKNTLIQKALEKIGGYDRVFDHLAGPTGGDLRRSAARVIRSSPKHKSSLKVCVIEREVYDGSKLGDARIRRAQSWSGNSGNHSGPWPASPAWSMRCCATS